LPGNFSALGLLLADVRRDYVLTRISAAAATSRSEIKAVLDELAERGRQELAQSGFEEDRCRFSATLDMRYAGQSFELSVPVTDAHTDADAIIRSFTEIYTARYGAPSHAVVEIVSYRVAAWAMTDKPELPRLNDKGRSLEGAKVGTRDVVFDGKTIRLDLLDRGSLPLNRSIAGPVLIEESGTSTIVPGGWSATLEPFGCLVLSRE
jgi:N-methylhydantoinase A